MTDRNKLICIMSKIVPLPFHQLARIADYLTEHGVTVQKWIPVTERLPEDEVDVLACDVRDGFVGVCYLQYCERWVCRDWFLDLSEITHWMPLPEPPKEV